MSLRLSTLREILWIGVEVSVEISGAVSFDLCCRLYFFFSPFPSSPRRLTSSYSPPFLPHISHVRSPVSTLPVLRSPIHPFLYPFRRFILLRSSSLPVREYQHAVINSHASYSRLHSSSHSVARLLFTALGVIFSLPSSFGSPYPVIFHDPASTLPLR